MEEMALAWKASAVTGRGLTAMSEIALSAATTPLDVDINQWLLEAVDYCGRLHEKLSIHLDDGSEETLGDYEALVAEVEEWLSHSQDDSILESDSNV